MKDTIKNKIMNNIKFKNIFPLAILFVLIATGCEKEDSEFVAQQSTPIVLDELSITELVIDGSNPNNPAVTFNWSDADFAQPTIENYDVEFSSDQGFTNPIVGASASGTSSVTMTMSTLNTTVGNAGLPPLQSNTIYVRVIGSVGTQGGLPVVSNVVNFDIVPFFNYTFKDLYLVGPACASGWDNNNNNPAMFRNGQNEDLFSYTGLFNGGQPLKMLEQRGAWAPQFGEDSPGALTRRPTEDDPDPAPINDIESLSTGYYTFDVNLNDLTFTITPFDESSAADYSSISIEGSAVGSTTTMTQFSFDPHLWRIPSVTLSVGSLTINADGTTWGSNTEFSGIATAGGGDIPVIVGDDYEVWFNDLTGEYILIPLTL